tara:strand:- start:224 stop:832 length:609 start_codon:yes stop_codon:yes gene_type:complete
MSTLETNLIQPATGTALTVGASGDTITIPSGATFNVAGTVGTGFTPGITEADEWRVTANFSGDAAPIASNWERNDTEFSKIGTGMTEASGIFSFPSTGIWLLQAQATFSNNTGNCHYNGLAIRTTVNNGGAWNGRADGNGSVSRPTSNNYYTQVAVKCIFDVTDTSNYKTSLQVYNQESNSIIYGNSNGQTTGITFIRLGDT